MKSRRAFASVLATLLAFAISGGIYAEIDLDGGHSSKTPGSQRARPMDAQPSGAAHGLMLYPLADPDGHVHNGAEAIDSTR